MQVINELLRTSSLYNINQIVKMVEENPGLVKNLVTVTIGKGNDLPMRASWALTHCHDKMPELLQPYLDELIKASPGVQHTGTRRNILRILSFETIPEDLQVFLFDHCLGWVISKKEPIAVKAFAMQILSNIALLQPDFKNEVITVILDIMPNGSNGLRSRGKKILKKLGIRDDEYI